MIIYCLTDWGSDMSNPNSNYYATLQGVCNAIKPFNPVDNKMAVNDFDTAGIYDINPDNLNYLLEESQKNNFGAMFRIKMDVYLRIQITFTLSIINVND